MPLNKRKLLVWSLNYYVFSGFYLKKKYYNDLYVKVSADDSWYSKLFSSTIAKLCEDSERTVIDISVLSVLKFNSIE